MNVSARERALRRSASPYALIVRPRARAMCHPTRNEARDGLCRECYQTRGRGLATGRDVLPALVRGAEQRAGLVVPERCPHCKAEPPGWQRSATEGRCWICGCDFFASSGRVLSEAEARRLAINQS